MTLTDRSSDVVEFILNALDLPTSPEILDVGNLYEVLGQDFPFRPDMMLKAGGRLYFIEVVSRVASLDTIARMQLLRELWRRKGQELPEPVLVIAARAIHPREEQLAEKLDIQVIRLPWKPDLPLKHEYKPSKSRLTPKNPGKLYPACSKRRARPSGSWHYGRVSLTAGRIRSSGRSSSRRS